MQSKFNSLVRSGEAAVEGEGEVAKDPLTLMLRSSSQLKLRFK